MHSSEEVSAVIIANGKYPTHPFPLTCIEKVEYLVCCDGAANEFIARGGKPNAIVGDCDSLSVPNKERFAAILHHDPDQESNDLTKAVHFCVQQDKRNIVIVAATGKREDHTLGNISLLAEYMLIADVVMITDYGFFTPVRSETVFHSFKGQQVSIFSIDAQPLTVDNLKFPVENRILTNW